MKAKENNILGDLITSAIKDAYECGSGFIEDEEDTILAVSSEWENSPEDSGISVIRITIFQNNIALLSYIEPGTQAAY